MRFIDYLVEHYSYIDLLEANKTIKPKNKAELEKIITSVLRAKGNTQQLNFIDTSLITDMGGLFRDSEFNGDISEWDVSNVIDMSDMFRGSKFNKDISEWDVSKVANMDSMFKNSKFNGDISKWNVSNVKTATDIFVNSRLTKYTDIFSTQNDQFSDVV